MAVKPFYFLLDYLKNAEHNVKFWEHTLVKNLRNLMNRTCFMSSNVTNLLFTKRAPDGGYRAGGTHLLLVVNDALTLQRWNCTDLFLFLFSSLDFGREDAPRT